MTDNMSPEELLLCIEVVNRVAQAIKAPGPDGELAVTNEVGHYTTLRYGRLTLYVYHDGKRVDIQTGGSGIKSYNDGGALADLLQETDQKRLDELRDHHGERWVSLVSEALHKADSD